MTVAVTMATVAMKITEDTGQVTRPNDPGLASSRGEH
jgi:hypothetical protein